MNRSFLQYPSKTDYQWDFCQNDQIYEYKCPEFDDDLPAVYDYVDLKLEIQAHYLKMIEQRIQQFPQLQNRFVTLNSEDRVLKFLETQPIFMRHVSVVQLSDVLLNVLKMHEMQFTFITDEHHRIVFVGPTNSSNYFRQLIQLNKVAFRIKTTRAERKHEKNDGALRNVDLSLALCGLKQKLGYNPQRRVRNKQNLNIIESSKRVNGVLRSMQLPEVSLIDNAKIKQAMDLKARFREVGQ